MRIWLKPLVALLFVIQSMAAPPALEAKSEKRKHATEKKHKNNAKDRSKSRSKSGKKYTGGRSSKKPTAKKQKSKARPPERKQAKSTKKRYEEPKSKQAKKGKPRYEAPKNNQAKKAKPRYQEPKYKQAKKSQKRDSQAKREKAKRDERKDYERQKDRERAKERDRDRDKDRRKHKADRDRDHRHYSDRRRDHFRKHHSGRWDSDWRDYHYHKHRHGYYWSDNNDWWIAVSIGFLGGWLVNSALSEPVRYSDDYIYVYDDTVYIDGAPRASVSAYALEAKALAESAPRDGGNEKLLQPLGFWALSPASNPDADPILFLNVGISRDGVLAGSHRNELLRRTDSVLGMTDLQTQRAAWQVDDEPWPVFETSLGDLASTDGYARVLVHFENGETQEWDMVRLEK